MGFLSNQLLKVIEWADSSSDTIAYKFPMPANAQIMNGSQFIVRESQVGILVSSGRIADVFEPGRYKLTTENMPVLTQIMSWKYGFKSPFVCDVYFINTKQFINQKWGTTSPIMMRDADFGAIQFRGFGIYSFKIDDASLFLREILGSGASYQTPAITEQLKRQIVSGITQAVAESKVAALDLAAKYSELSDSSAAIVKPKFSMVGMTLSSLTIENLSLTEESQKALERRSQMNILGNSSEYTAYAAADSMKVMAENAHKGQGMNVGGMGMGLGTGWAMTNMYAQNIASAQGQAKAETAEKVAQKSEAKILCPKCGKTNTPSAKFCLECGAKLQQACPKCNAVLTPGQKFCGSCGEKLGEAGKVCSNCKKEIPAGSQFCSECGTRN